jgi:hypothetical protein
MATDTKKKGRKSSSGKPRRRVVASRPKPEASSNGEAKAKSAGPGKFDPAQKPLDTMEDVDERVPELDEECDRYLAADEKRKSSKVERDETAGRIGDLLKEHNLACYILKGKKFYIEPGTPSVKVTKVKRGE